jgi:hypothetical protein
MVYNSLMPETMFGNVWHASFVWILVNGWQRITSVAQILTHALNVDLIFRIATI